MSSAQRRLLVVEDSPDVVAALRDLLEHPLVALEIATNGVEAVARARETKPHAILLDVRLPGMDGFEVFHILRRDDALRFARVIFLTAVAEDGALVLAKELGAFACMRKPFDEVRLQARVFEALGLVDREETKRRLAVEGARRIAARAAEKAEKAEKESASPAPGPEAPVVLVVALEDDVVRLKRRVEERAAVRAVPVVTEASAIRLGRSPLVRAILVDTPPAGLSLDDLVRLLRETGARAPIVRLGEESDRLLATLGGRPGSDAVETVAFEGDASRA